MILSSADILRILGGSEIIRLSARIKITDQKPTLSGDDQLLIYISRFPSVAEFEATWTIWLEGDGETALVAAEIKRLLPKVQHQPGLITTLTTTDFRSEHTQTAPEAPKAQKAQIDTSAFEDRFQSLQEDIQDQMLLVSSGRPGKDGKDGKDGADGKDGKDIDATQTELFDLKDVDQAIPLEKGQVLTWDGNQWTNLYQRRSSWITGGSTSSGGSGGGGDQVSATIQWKFHSTAHEEEPDPGDFHTDTDDGDLVTVFHVSDETSRGNNVEVLVRDLLQQGYDRIYVASSNDLSQAHLYAITGYSETASGFEINVVHVDTAGTEPDFVSPKLYEFLFTKSAVADGGGIPEAPIDGQQYARQDAGWSVVEMPEGGIEEAPMDGNYYVRQNGAWLNLETALKDLGFVADKITDGGNFTTGETLASDDIPGGGGNFTTGSSNAVNNDSLDGGLITGVSINTGDVIVDGGNFSEN